MIHQLLVLIIFFFGLGGIGFVLFFLLQNKHERSHRVPFLFLRFDNGKSSRRGGQFGYRVYYRFLFFLPKAKPDQFLGNLLSFGSPFSYQSTEQSGWMKNKETNEVGYWVSYRVFARFNQVNFLLKRPNVLLRIIIFEPFFLLLSFFFSFFFFENRAANPVVPTEGAKHSANSFGYRVFKGLRWTAPNANLASFPTRPSHAVARSLRSASFQ